MQSRGYIHSSGRQVNLLLVYTADVGSRARGSGEVDWAVAIEDSVVNAGLEVVEVKPEDVIGPVPRGRMNCRM